MSKITFRVADIQRANRRDRKQMKSQNHRDERRIMRKGGR
jgi:hypothetical protein